MRPSIWLLVFTLLFLGCAQKVEETGISIVEKSIVAHGGWENYNALQKVVFVKTTRLFTEKGSFESEQAQLQEFKLKPNFLLRMSWLKDSLEQVIFYDHLNAEVFEDSIEVKATARIKAAKQAGASATYVFFQPFKLISDGAQLTFEKETVLLDSIQVKEVSVHYPNDLKNSDQWFYYFNDAYQLAAAKVVHQDRISLIINTSFQEYEGVLFNKTRKSYFVNSENQVKYLRASYDYSIQE